MLYRVSKKELEILDAFEGAGKGRGYIRCDQFSVHLAENDKIVNTKTYLASCTKSDLKPYDWYLALVIAGVFKHRLGDAHLKMLQRVPYLPDPNCMRRERCVALEVLAEAGFPDYRSLLRQA